MSYMKRILFKVAVFIRIASLLMGCASSSTVNVNTINRSHSSGRAKNYKVRVISLKSDIDLKGKGSTAESNSKNATSKKMEDWDITAQRVKEIAPIVERAARENKIPASLIFGVIWVESRFNPEASSGVGARGLMQLMPKTARYLAECIDWPKRVVDIEDPEFNIAAGSYYVARLIKQFNGDLDLALAAYNAGPGNIAKWMNNTGLPDVSIEYYTMVETAAGYFRSPSEDSNFSGSSVASSGGSSIALSGEKSGDSSNFPDKETLDKLGLAILISGLSDKDFGINRVDDANPFD